MKIYVDEMPKSCDDCQLCQQGSLKLKKNGRYTEAKCCVLGNYYKYQKIDDEIDTCPLNLLVTCQQLAEKEKEIKDMKASSDKNIDYLIEFSSLIEDEKDCNRMLKALDSVKQGKKYIVDKANQDKISFAVNILEELADCSNYINSKLDFECGSYVSEKTIRDKIKYLKGKKDES